MKQEETVKNNEMKYQATLIHDLSEDYPDFKVLVMHNEKEKHHLATQVEVLTEGDLTYGQFQQESGYLINKFEKIAIILPEKALEERHLFENIKKEFDFSTKDVEFIIKKSLSDIEYYTRENNEKGDLELNGKSFKVFEQQPSGPGDRARALIVKNEAPKIKVKAKNQRSNKNKIY